MNARRRLEREMVRRRRREPWPQTFTRIVTPNGTWVRVVFTPWRQRDPRWMRATYFARHAHTGANWPPTPELFRELGRWA